MLLRTERAGRYHVFRYLFPFAHSPLLLSMPYTMPSQRAMSQRILLWALVVIVFAGCLLVPALAKDNGKNAPLAFLDSGLVISGALDDPNQVAYWEGTSSNARQSALLHVTTNLLTAFPSMRSRQAFATHKSPRVYIDLRLRRPSMTMCRALLLRPPRINHPRRRSTAAVTMQPLVSRRRSPLMASFAAACESSMSRLTLRKRPRTGVDRHRPGTRRGLRCLLNSNNSGDEDGFMGVPRRTRSAQHDRDHAVLSLATYSNKTKTVFFSTSIVQPITTSRPCRSSSSFTAVVGRTEQGPIMTQRPSCEPATFPLYRS